MNFFQKYKKQLIILAIVLLVYVVIYSFLQSSWHNVKSEPAHTAAEKAKNPFYGLPTKQLDGLLLICGTRNSQQYEVRGYIKNISNNTIKVRHVDQRHGADKTVFVLLIPPGYIVKMDLLSTDGFIIFDESGQRLLGFITAKF